MSRGKGKKKGIGLQASVSREKFVSTPADDKGETQAHLTPVPLRHDTNRTQIGTVGGVPVYESVDVPTGAWVDVPKGMTAVPGCYIDPNGIMRFKENNAPAVWHHPSGCKYHQPPCRRRITNPADIVYDDNNAPWCPDCIGWGAQDLQYKMRDASANAKVIKETEKTLAQHLESIVGPFEESTEFGPPSRKLTEADIQKLQAASAAPMAPEVFRGQASKQRYFPSGNPRRW